eukprot:141451-Pelagomonas_calceolata.AAC.2
MPEKSLPLIALFNIENKKISQPSPGAGCFQQPSREQRCTKLAQKLHAHSAQYAHKFTSTRRAIDHQNTHSGALGPRAARDPPDPH